MNVSGFALVPHGTGGPGPVRNSAVGLSPRATVEEPVSTAFSGSPGLPRGTSNVQPHVLSSGLSAPPPSGCPSSGPPNPVTSALGSLDKAVNRGARASTSPAGVMFRPLCASLACLPGDWKWPRTSPPSLSRGSSPWNPFLCLPSSWPQESVLGIWPRAPFSSPRNSCENVFTGVYFLLEMSLLGMNVVWFVLKLINCLTKTCGWSMRQPLRGGERA